MFGRGARLGRRLAQGRLAHGGGKVGEDGVGQEGGRGAEAVGEDVRGDGGRGGGGAGGGAHGRRGGGGGGGLVVVGGGFAGRPDVPVGRLPVGEVFALYVGISTAVRSGGQSGQRRVRLGAPRQGAAQPGALLRRRDGRARAGLSVGHVVLLVVQVVGAAAAAAGGGGRSGGPLLLLLEVGKEAAQKGRVDRRQRRTAAGGAGADRGLALAEVEARPAAAAARGVGRPPGPSVDLGGGRRAGGKPIGCLLIRLVGGLDEAREEAAVVGLDEAHAVGLGGGRGGGGNSGGLRAHGCIHSRYERALKRGLFPGGLGDSSVSCNKKNLSSWGKKEKARQNAVQPTRKSKQGRSAKKPEERASEKGGQKIAPISAPRTPNTTNGFLCEEQSAVTVRHEEIIFGR